MFRVLLVAVLTVFATSSLEAQQQLSKQVQADIAIQEISAAISKNNPDEALNGISRYRQIGVAVAPKIIFVEARLAFIQKDYERSQKALTEYLGAVTSSDPSYLAAIKMAPEVNRLANERAAAKAKIKKAESEQRAAASVQLTQQLLSQVQAKPFRPCPECPEIVRLPIGSVISITAHNGNILTKIERAFALGTSEISQREWSACVRAGGCPDIPLPKGFGPDHPALVTQDEADSFVAWLTQISGYAFRIPQFAELAYAAYGGGTQPYYVWRRGDGRNPCDLEHGAFFKGNAAPKQFPSLFACSHTSLNSFLPVRSFWPNPLGFYDIAGNVDEMSSTCYNKEADTGSRFVQKDRQENCRGRMAMSSPSVYDEGIDFFTMDDTETTFQFYRRTGLRVAL